VEVHAGETFIQRAWFYGHEGVSFGCRFLDTEGKQLGNSVLQANENAEGWVLYSRRLEAKNDDQRRGETIPADTAFLEPFVQVNSPSGSPDEQADPIRWAGLLLGSVSRHGTTTSSSIANPVPPVIPPILPKKNNAPGVGHFFTASAPTQRIAVSADSQLVTVSDQNGVVYLIEYPSGKKLASIHSDDDAILAVGFLDHTHQVITVDEMGNVHRIRFSPDVDDQLIYCTGHYPQTALITSDGKWAFLGTTDQKRPRFPNMHIEVVDLKTGKRIKTLDSPGFGGAIAISPDEKQLLVKQLGWHLSSFALPSFQALPDVEGDAMNDHGTIFTHSATDGGGNAEIMPHASDLSRQFLAVQESGRLTVRNLSNNQTFWGFSASPDFTSIAIVPKDGVILAAGNGQNAIGRFIIPKASTPDNQSSK
jgi:hypothetical protein